MHSQFHSNKVILKTINDGFAIQLAFGVYSAIAQTHHLQALQTDKSQNDNVSHQGQWIIKGNGMSIFTRSLRWLQFIISFIIMFLAAEVQ